MKFGKRLGAEASRGWQGTYLDYKACKRAIRQDVDNKGPFIPGSCLLYAERSPREEG
jgi:SPX domain protein involved in polyphosphate accumulation